MEEKIIDLRFEDIIKKLKTGEISCESLLTETLKQIGTFDPILHAYIAQEKKELLMRQAEESTRRWQSKSQKSLIDGIPIAIKDNMHVTGMNTTCGSKILYNYSPPFDATVISSIKDMGGIILGKTNMDEFAMGSTTEFSQIMKTKNPWNINKVPGGSSGGSAATIASRMGVLALGSDTGGSIRQPAAFCGITGLKPTYGLVSRYGLVAYASSLDQIGPMSGDIYGNAVLLDIIAGYDPKDSTSLMSTKKEYVKGLGTEIKGMRIAVFPELYKDGISGGVKIEFEQALQLLRSLGAIIEEVSFDAINYIIPAYYFIATAEASSNLSRYDGVKYGYRSKKQLDYEEMLFATRSEGFGKEVKKRILLGNFVLSSGYYDEYYIKAQKVRRHIMDEMKKIFSRFDCIATPTTPDIAYDFGESTYDPLKIYLADVTTVLPNLAGVPALSVPCGLINNMPIGLQLIGPPLCEDTLLKTGYLFEKNLHMKFHPPLEKLLDTAENNTGENEERKKEFALKEESVVIYSDEKIKDLSMRYMTREKTPAKRVLCKDLPAHLNQDVVIQGWVHMIYDLGGIRFYIMRDRTGLTQLVLEEPETEKEITLESVIEVYGKVTTEERSPYNTIEIKTKKIIMTALADSGLPITINSPYTNLNLHTILENRPLSIRNLRVRKIFTIQSEIVRLFGEFMRNNSFTEIKTPKIIATGTEGGTNIFELKYFDGAAFLAQSPQFYKQMMVGSGFERVFEVGPVFRAENHDTIRHLNEYTSMDFEMGFIRDEQDIIDMQESFIRHMVRTIQEKYKDILDEFKSTVLLPERIPRIHFLEALRIADSYGVKDLDGDISPAGERVLCSHFEKEKASSFVYIIGYPIKKRPMYTMPDESCPGYTRSFDLLCKGLEVTTGGMRIHDYNMLRNNMKKFGCNPKEFSSYLQTFKYGMPAHGGLGMGLERLTMQLLSLKNIREATLFPRDRNRITP